jgi:signal peptidase I
MSETETTTDAPAGEAPEKKPEKKEEPFWRFLIKLLLVILIFRSFVFSPFNIPSESMLPRLENGDYLLASKWSYGYSRFSLPFSLPLIPGRIFASEPERGDVVIFKAPPADTDDYIKRVIGLPGDQIEMRGGVVLLNGEPIRKERLEDFVIPVSPNTRCAESRFAAVSDAGDAVCRYPQFRETLPDGRSYEVLDFGRGPVDDFGPVVVPKGSMFLMGDNRDNSQDSRFPAVPGGGVGIVPQDNLVGQAAIVMWSTDGSAEWIKPWTWFTAARWDRIGGTF